ncbi:extracellular solute-binding protein [Actinocrispum wychmicini]|uniref:Multiple sugar transport system substrate-binding protein n=1 Tax=Actinocrispum wychmicini TaxID=1213861 RepID=A0A4R2J5M3_9PSEU|nr:extracellular solute-binding protein [Actinocrispum wychmicini]TCO53644.1 multiple sugar transport system substrate-binding protein [Actinocrispum wychmicini]
MDRRLVFGLGAVAGAAVMALVAFLLVPSFTPDNGLEPGELVLLSGKDQSDGGQRQELVNQWNQLHPANKATIVELPLGADDQYSEIVARAQSPTGQADVYNLDVVWTAEFADAGYLTPLSDVDTSGFLAGPLATCAYDGKLWGLPFNTDAGLMYYRDPGKAPRDWNDIVHQTQEVFAGAHDPRLRAGYTAQLSDYEGLVVNALEAIWAANGELVDKDGNVRIDTPETQTGLRRLAEGLHGTDPRVVLPESRGEDETSSMEAFGAGKTLFMRNWPVAYRHLQQMASDDSAVPSFFKVVKLPGPSVLGGQNLAVASKSTKPKAAKALIEFLTSPRSQQILFERGGFAATRDIVYLDAEVKKRYPYATALLDAIRDARPRPVSPHYVRFAQAFREIIKETLDGDGRVPSDASTRLTAALRGQ